MENNDSFMLDGQKENIKLTKNSKGVYQWEIKLMDDALSLVTIQRLEELNQALEERYA